MSPPKKMKTLLYLLVSFSLLTSCKAPNKVHTIESIFEIKIPLCYEMLPNPVQIFDYNPHTIIELKLEKECMWEMYYSQMNPTKEECSKYYVGTTSGDHPAWMNDQKKAFMYLNLKTCLLHFEDYD